MVREFRDVRQMDREVRKLVRQGWTVADTQSVPVKTENRGCGCLLGMFGGGRGRSTHTNKYVVRFEKRPG